MRQFVSFVLAAVFLAATVPSQAQQRAPIRYTLRFPGAADQLRRGRGDRPHRRPPVDRHDDGGLDAGVVPDSEYERNVEAVKATAGGRALAIEKTAKNRWRIATGGAREVTLTYRVYATR